MTTEELAAIAADESRYRVVDGAPDPSCTVHLEVCNTAGQWEPLSWESAVVMLRLVKHWRDKDRVRAVLALAECQARAEKGRQERDALREMMRTGIALGLDRAEAAESALAECEARAASIRRAGKAAWVLIHEQMERMDDDTARDVADQLHEAISTDAGEPLLAEVEALRTVAFEARAIWESYDGEERWEVPGGFADLRKALDSLTALARPGEEAT